MFPPFFADRRRSGCRGSGIEDASLEVFHTGIEVERNHPLAGVDLAGVTIKSTMARVSYHRRHQQLEMLRVPDDAPARHALPL
jgi:hypothetical protein